MDKSKVQRFFMAMQVLINKILIHQSLKLILVNLLISNNFAFSN